MVKTTEGTFTLSDGMKLYEKTWEPDVSPPTAHMIALHGFSDHINAYYNLFPTLASEPYNIAVHGIDQRGWGRSVTKKSERGLSGDTRQVMKDIDEHVAHIHGQMQSSGVPLFLFGHSMGGNEALWYLLTSPSQHAKYFAGVVLESPFIANPPAEAPPALVVTLGKFAAKFIPSYHLVNKLDPSAMSRDPKVCQEWVDDELCHDTGTLAGVAGLLQRAEDLSALAKGRETGGLSAPLPCPAFWAHGTGDLVCSYDESKALYERIGSNVAGSECKWYPGAYHKLHADAEGVGEQFAKDTGAWVVEIARDLNRRTETGGGTGGSGTTAVTQDTSTAYSAPTAAVPQTQTDVKSRL